MIFSFLSEKSILHVNKAYSLTVLPSWAKGVGVREEPMLGTFSIFRTLL